MAPVLGRGAGARPRFVRPSSRTLALFVFVALAACARLLPHPPNFTPIGAMALFGGASFARRSHAVLVPLAAMLASDVVLGFHAGQPIVYAAFAASVAIGRLALRRRASTLRIAGASLGSATLFFLVTNAAVWIGSTTYAQDASGLLRCLAMGLPFFRNDVAGHLVFGGVLFGAWAWSERRFPSLARAPLAALRR